MKVIGLGHRAQNGKDQMCQMLISECGKKYQIMRFAFADALKREVNAMLERAGGVDAFFARKDLLPWVVREENPDMKDPLCPLGKFRTLLQYVGVLRRESDPDYWVNQTIKDINKHQPDLAIITDMRFQNEVKMVKQLGGYTCRVRRTGYVSNVPLHISETCLDSMTDWDYQIDAADLGQLKEQALRVFDNIIKL
jgi:hypothetical protein